MQLPEEPEHFQSINIVPMIDVIFAILTFFIMSTLFLTRSQGLPVNLPKAATSLSQPEAPLTVTLNPLGKLALNREPIELSELSSKVQEFIQDEDPILVIINADEKVSHGQVIAVMDRLRSLPQVRLAIATTQPESR